MFKTVLNFENWNFCIICFEFRYSNFGFIIIMGKVKPRILGLEDVEKKQKEAQKKKAAEKKLSRETAEPDAENRGKEMANVGVERAQPDKKAPTKKKNTETSVVHVRGKKYQKARKSVDKTKTYALDESISLLRKMKYADFDESVELHLNIDKSGLRGEVDLPHATGKTLRVKIVDDQVIAELEKGKMEFDVLVTHPSFMARLARFAKVLGPKGLMPNPKAGTISQNPEETAKKFAKGNLHWKAEAKFPLIHQIIGKISGKDAALIDNAKAFLTSVGFPHIKSAFIKSTMSPAVKIDLEKI